MNSNVYYIVGTTDDTKIFWIRYHQIIYKTGISTGKTFGIIIYFIIICTLYTTDLKLNWNWIKYLVELKLNY